MLIILYWNKELPPVTVVLKGDVLRMLVSPCYNYNMGRGFFPLSGPLALRSIDGHGDKEEKSLD